MDLFAVLLNKKLVRENRTMKNYKIAVAGTGYVGLSLGVLLSQHHQVVAVDIVQAKVDMINNKKSPIQDDYIRKRIPVWVRGFRKSSRPGGCFIPQECVY